MFSLFGKLILISYSKCKFLILSISNLNDVFPNYNFDLASIIFIQIFWEGLNKSRECSSEIDDTVKGFCNAIF